MNCMYEKTITYGQPPLMQLYKDIKDLKESQARIEALLREVLCPSASVEIKELARQFAGGNRQALREWNKRKQNG